MEDAASYAQASFYVHIDIPSKFHSAEIDNASSNSCYIHCSQADDNAPHDRKTATAFLADHNSRRSRPGGRGRCMNGEGSCGVLAARNGSGRRR